MPSAEMLRSAFHEATPATAEGDPKRTGEVARIAADALSEGESGLSINALLDGLPAKLSDHGGALEAGATWDAIAVLALGPAQPALAMEVLAVHPDMLAVA